MAEFRTKISVPEFPFSISHHDVVFSIGSCFAEHIGQQLERFKFQTLLNPFGILYNPLSIANALERLLNHHDFSAEQLFEYNGLWHSFEHHGSFSHPDKAKVLDNIRDSIQEGREFLKKSNRLIITLGTAHVFVYKKTEEVVANCHKLPGIEFDRKRLSVEHIAGQLSSSFEKLKRQHPKLEILLTISPVRHIRDGLIENQKSKATLLLAVEELCTNLSFVHYFPAYEIQMDDLRDYRFYEPDMIHPNAQAVDYIWKFFSEAFFDPDTKDLIRKVDKINQAVRHKAFHQASGQHQLFLKNQLMIIDRLEATYGFLTFDKERAFFSEQII